MTGKMVEAASAMSSQDESTRLIAMMATLCDGYEFGVVMSSIESLVATVVANAVDERHMVGEAMGFFASRINLLVPEAEKAFDAVQMMQD